MKLVVASGQQHKYIYCGKFFATGKSIVLIPYRILVATGQQVNYHPCKSIAATSQHFTGILHVCVSY